MALVAIVLERLVVGYSPTATGRNLRLIVTLGLLADDVERPVAIWGPNPRQFNAGSGLPLQSDLPPHRAADCHLSSWP